MCLASSGSQNPFARFPTRSRQLLQELGVLSIGNDAGYRRSHRFMAWTALETLDVPAP